MSTHKHRWIELHGEEGWEQYKERNKENNRLRVCKEYWKIENYEAAKADDFKGWVLHHRLELTLDGDEVHRADSLKRLNMYYDRPYFELIYLPRKVHTSLHNRNREFSKEYRRKLSVAAKNRRR